MSAALRIGAFAAILAVVFAAAALAGSEVDPSVDESTSEHDEAPGAMRAHDSESENRAGGAHAADAGAPPPGLAVAEKGLRLVPERTSLSPDPTATYRFRVVDAAGETVREFDVEHEREMHLIMIRRDFAGFQHLHPRRLPDGTWETDADLSDAGVYRVFADFSSGGESLTLAADLFVPGNFEPQALPEPAGVAAAGEGYEVRLDSATPRPGARTAIEFTVMLDGRPVEGVEPYLGADGHLVALREHDQAFLHTHPEGAAGGKGPIRFEVSYPTAGRYRLFLQFRHAGEVRTAAFTQELGDANLGAKANAIAGAREAHDAQAGHGH